MNIFEWINVSLSQVDASLWLVDRTMETGISLLILLFFLTRASLEKTQTEKHSESDVISN